jgi:DNA-binding transcriptional regulator YiaG
LEIIQSISDINKLRLMNIQDRSKAIKEIRDKTEASNRQLSRVLNIGRGILDRIK